MVERFKLSDLDRYHFTRLKSGEWSIRIDPPTHDADGTAAAVDNNPDSE